MFKLTILNPERVIFEGDVQSLFLAGDQGEFELLDHHSPLISVLREGQIVVNWKAALPVSSGLVKFFNNECTILIEDTKIKEAQ